MAGLIVVEDDPLVRELVTHVLVRAGHDVRAAPDGAALKQLAAARRPDLVILDLTLPDDDGLSLARWLRGSEPQPGIVMLTALGQPMDRVLGLEAGADDYLGKPFEPAELLARVDAVLRRRRPAAAVRLGPWRLDAEGRGVVHDDGRRVGLVASELALLAAFARNAGRVLSRDELLDLAPGRDEESYDRSIDHRISRLRLKLEADPRHPALIRNVRGRGYLHPR
ncbi:MAG: response regulator transcription factor [Geminicoccaceae bacterium]